MTELYLYQTIHLFRGRARLLEAHVALLDEASRELFDRPYTPDPRQLESRIINLARAERYPQNLSGFVRIELTADGQERLIPAGVSLYEGYALRSILPDAVTVAYDPAVSEAPTSAREAAALMARQYALRKGATVAVRVDRTGRCLTADDAPLFAVRGNTIYAGPAPFDVLRDPTRHAVRAAGLEYREEPFGVEALSAFDELFFVDHRGVTALAHCNGTPYMHLTAERIAKAMEGLFSKV